MKRLDLLNSLFEKTRFTKQSSNTCANPSSFAKYATLKNEKTKYATLKNGFAKNATLKKRKKFETLRSLSDRYNQFGANFCRVSEPDINSSELESIRPRKFTNFCGNPTKICEFLVETLQKFVNFCNIGRIKDRTDPVSDSNCRIHCQFRTLEPVDVPG